MIVAHETRARIPVSAVGVVPLFAGYAVGGGASDGGEVGGEDSDEGEDGDWDEDSDSEPTAHDEDDLDELQVERMAVLLSGGVGADMDTAGV